jgi:hypothetical protein
MISVRDYTCGFNPDECPNIVCGCAPPLAPAASLVGTRDRERQGLPPFEKPPLSSPELGIPFTVDPRTKETNPKDAIGDKKPPLWLCSPIAKAKWAVAQFVGMVKYGAWNWRSAGIRNSIYLSAIQRHLDAYMSGEEVDPIDQTDHMGHIMACAAIIIDAKAAGKLIDDRPPSVDLRQAYADVEKQMVLARKNYGTMNPRHFTIADTGSISAATP